MPYNLKRKRAEAAVAEKQKHYERMLRDMAGESENEEKSEEALLEKQRTGKSPEGTTENLLDSVRKEAKDIITEKRLNEEDPSFGGVNRSDPLEGSQVPPLEKKRLASKDAMEKEKYEKANTKSK